MKRSSRSTASANSVADIGMKEVDTLAASLMRRFSIFHGVFCLLVTLAVISCKSDDGQDCTPGTLDCECHMGSECFGALVCTAGVCVPDEVASGTDTGSEMGTSSGDDVDTTSTTTSTDTSTSSTDTGGCAPGLTDCSGSCVDLTTDMANCGMCGNECSGGCNAGECEPALTDCVALQDPQQDCTVICGGLGKTCADAGCNGATWWGYVSEPACLNDQAGVATNLACQTLPGPDFSYVRCCCQ